MFKLVLTKVVKNYRLMLCLLIGILLASSLLSSIPEYTASILQKALITDLEQSQKSTGVYPGLNVIKHDYSDDTTQKRTAYLVQDSNTIAAYNKEIGIPILQKSIIYQTDSFTIQNATNAEFNFANVTDFNKHIKLLNGRLPVATGSGEPLEVMVTSSAMANMNLSLNETYRVLSDTTTNTTGKSYQVKIVGAFEPKNAKDLYWSTGWKMALMVLYFYRIQLFRPLSTQQKTIYWVLLIGALFLITAKSTFQISIIFLP